MLGDYSFFLFFLVQGDSFEDVNHSYYLLVGILFFLLYLFFPKYFASQKIDYYLFLKVGTFPQKVFLGRLQLLIKH